MGEHLCELVDCPRCSNALPSTLQSQCQAAHWPSGCFARRDDLDQHVHGTCEARPGDMGPSSHRVLAPGVPCIGAFGRERIARVWRVVVHPRAHCVAARHKMWAAPMLLLAPTGEKQVPWESHALRARFYFNAAPVVTPPTAPQASEAERTWQWIKEATNQTVLENFIKEFGDTPFGARASKLRSARASRGGGTMRPPTCLHLLRWWCHCTQDRFRHSAVRPWLRQGKDRRL